MNNDNNNLNNNNIINDRYDKIINKNDKIPLQESFLFKIKDKKNKLDFYKTSNLFSISENDEIDNVDKSTIIKKIGMKYAMFMMVMIYMIFIMIF